MARTRASVSGVRTSCMAGFLLAARRGCNAEASGASTAPMVHRQHVAMASESKTAVVAALAGNAALALLKGVTPALTGSAAMLAEALHPPARTRNQTPLFVGMPPHHPAPHRAPP